MFTVVGVLLLAYVAYSITRSAGRVEEAQQIVVTEQALSEVSDPLAALCAEDPTIRARVGAACATAALVVSAPPESPADGLNGRDGANGEAGTDGLDGLAGRNGVDGQSPPCLDTAERCAGRDGANGQDGADGSDGADGQNGADGTNGADGRDGSPAAELIVNRTDGTQLRCPRTGGDDVAPVYTCQAA